MGTTPNYTNVPVVGSAVLNLGDVSRIAPVNVVTIFPSSTNGGSCERIVLTPLGTLTASVIGLFRYDGTTFHEYGSEITIPALTAANGTANPGITLEAYDNPNLFPIALPALWSLRATINDTQIGQEMSISSIAQSQTLAGAGPVSLNGSNVVAASATAIATAAAPVANAPMTLTSGPYVMTNPALLTLTSGSNVSTVSYQVTGRTAAGAIVSEAMTGPNANTVYSVNVYKAILSIVPTTSNAGTVSAGYSTVAGTAVLPLPTKIMISSGGNISAVNFTITGTNSSGTVQTEVLSGPNVNEVQSANSYTSVLTIAASAAVSTAVLVGNPPILSGISIQGEGGTY